MESVYKLLPTCIPLELHSLIYMYAGTCTPSCAIMKMYIEYVKTHRPSTLGNTLWSWHITWDTPKYLKRWTENRDLTATELDLKIAWYVLKFEEYTSLNFYLDTSYEYTYMSTIDWYEIEIGKLNKVLTERLFCTLKEMHENKLIA